ncbi:MAG: hypothetical protein ACKN9T_07880 [Candidatus Methylumidiphilus sp.]
MANRNIPPVANCVRENLSQLGFELIFGQNSPQIAVVIGNGPSAKSLDFGQLRIGHVASVGMDAAYVDWQAIDFYPTYYVCLDQALILGHADNIASLVKEGKIRKFFLLDELKRRHPELEGHERIYWRSQAQGESAWFRAGNPASGAWAVRWMLDEGMRLVAMVGLDGEALRDLPYEAARLGSDAKLIALDATAAGGLGCADFFGKLRMPLVTSFRADLDAEALANNLVVAAANCANPYISQVHIMLEGARESLDASLAPDIGDCVRGLEACGKLHITLISQRPSYKYLLEYTNRLGSPRAVIANSDIVIPRMTAAQLAIDQFKDAAPLCAITRWNLTGAGIFLQGMSPTPPWAETALEGFALTDKNFFSYDTYVFDTPILVPAETGQVLLGSFGCDTALAAIFRTKGIGVGNPCLAYKTIHIDDKPRNYQSEAGKLDVLRNTEALKQSILSRYAGSQAIAASLGKLEQLNNSIAWIGSSGNSSVWNKLLCALGATPWSDNPRLPRFRFKKICVHGSGSLSFEPKIQGLAEELSTGNVFIEWELSGFSKNGHIYSFLQAHAGYKAIAAQIRSYHWQSAIHVDRATPEQRAIHADALAVIRELLAGSFVSGGPAKPGREAGAAIPPKKVSILLSCFNGDDFVEGYVDALLHPKITAVATLIAIDFPSSHRDPAFVERQLRRYPDLVLVGRQQNLSLYDAWNEAAGLAATEFVGNLNLDDRVAPTYYARAVATLEQTGGDVFSSCALTTDEPGRWENAVNLHEHIPASRFGGADTVEYGLESLVTLGEGRIVKKNPPHCAPVWRRSLHAELGGFDSRAFDFCADYAFWLRVASAGKKMLLAREPLTLFHKAAGTASDRLMHPESEAILERWRTAFPPRGYTPSRLGERNNFLHFCLNMNAIFSSPRYYAHLGDVARIDPRYAIRLADSPLGEPLSSLRARLPTGQVSLSEANRLQREGEFRAALDIYRLLYAERPFAMYRDNALWCCRKLGVDLSAATDLLGPPQHPTRT